MGTYLAIDLGTTGCRGILFDEKLRLLAVSYEEYGLITPKETWIEQDAELWWTLTLRVIRRATAESGRDPSEIRGIAVSSQGITVVPVDEDLRPLCSALSWLDVRAEAQADLCFDSSGLLAGSLLTMDQACRNLMHHTRCGITEAFLMASRNPARAIGLDSQVGTIEAGKKADLVFVDDMFHVENVMLEGVLRQTPKKETDIQC